MAKKNNNDKAAPELPLSLSDKIWSELTGVLLFLVALFLIAVMVSYNLGATTAARNIGAALGSLLSSVCFNAFGLVGYFVPLLFLVVGVNLVLLAQTRRHLRAAGFVALLALWLLLALAYVPGVGPVLNTTSPGITPTGILGEWLHPLLLRGIGHAGLITFLAAYGITLLVVFTPIRHSFGNWLRAGFSAIRGLATRKIIPEKPKLITPQPAVKKPAPKGAESESARTERPVQPSLFTPLPNKPAPGPVRTPAGEFSFSAEDFLGLLRETAADDQPVKDQAEAQQEAAMLLSKLREFGIDGRIENIYSGPVITRFELIPAPGVKIQRIESLSDDLALSLRAERIRILAPIPGKSAVGIEIPNRERKMVYLRSILESESFQRLTSPLGFALGTTITGEPYCADLSTMPHVLIAGTTGSGKSVCINTLVSSIIFRSSYKDVRFLTIDPKRLELPIYDPIPHLLFPTTVNSKEAVQKLDYVLGIMEMRYRDFAKVGARDIAGYNEKAASKKPRIVVIIDELADLMITAPSEIEEKITRLAQMSRAVGIHLVLATQRPSVDVITGLIKANFPCRIAFQVASKTDSRTILDMNGAESLLGRGDMLILPPGKGEPLRLHGAFISAEETQRIVKLLAKRYLAQLLTGLLDPELVEPAADEVVEKDLQNVLSQPGGMAFEERKRRLCSVVPPEVVETLLTNGYYQRLEEILPMPGTPEAEAAPDEDREIDEFFGDAARLVVRHQEASVSMLQRRLDVGWARAGRIIDHLEQVGIVGPYVGSKSRKVLVESEEELNNLLGEGTTDER
jgi:S-DNA-T family DNA segregation ATPase FtsK/SpoIIIE